MHPFKEMSVERERKKRQNTSKCHKVRVTKTGITRDKILMSRHTDRQTEMRCSHPHILAASGRSSSQRPDSNVHPNSQTKAQTLRPPSNCIHLGIGNKHDQGFISTQMHGHVLLDNGIP